MKTFKNQNLALVLVSSSLLVDGWNDRGDDSCFCNLGHMGQEGDSCEQSRIPDSVQYKVFVCVFGGGG